MKMLSVGRDIKSKKCQGNFKGIISTSHCPQQQAELQKQGRVCHSFGESLVSFD